MNIHALLLITTNMYLHLMVHPYATASIVETDAARAFNLLYVNLRLRHCGKSFEFELRLVKTAKTVQGKQLFLD